MLSLIDNIMGQEFREFISAHLDNGDSFSLTKNRWTNNDKLNFLLSVL